MKVSCPPGFLTDMPPIQAGSFWFYGENVRFRMGVPETVGLYSALLDGDGDQYQAVIEDGVADMYADRSLVIVGSGQRLSIIDFDAPSFTEVDLPTVGDTGRWWFTATEDTILAGRSNYTGKTIVIDRATKATSALPNAPDGGMGAGVVNGIFVKAGTAGFAGDGPKLVVRWSARRTDLSSSGSPSGPFGFEDWTPSDITASGEFLLDEGSAILGALSTSFGFLVWTDTRTYLMQPRSDSYVFTLSKVAQRGLLSPKSYGEADGRVWWWDSTRTLNVFDGGSVRQVANPMRHATIDQMIDAQVFDKCSVSIAPEYGEVILLYPDRAFGDREVVYNYLEDCWYTFNLGRVALTSASSERPSIGIKSNGRLYFYDVRESLAFGLTLPPGAPSPPGPTPIFTQEPFDWFIMTNHIITGSLASQSLRTRNVAMSYTVAQAFDAPAVLDTIRVSVRSWGEMDLSDPGVVDYQDAPLGGFLFPLRAGGKRMQLCVSGTGFRSLIRIGDIDVDMDEGGQK